MDLPFFFAAQPLLLRCIWLPPISGLVSSTVELLTRQYIKADEKRTLSRQRQYGKDSSDYPPTPSPFEKDVKYKAIIEEFSEKGKSKCMVIGL